MAFMRSNYSEQTTPFMSWVSEFQLERIHSASLEILQRTGTRVDHPLALKLLKEAGCLVKDNIAKIPPWLVEECIRTAPSKVTLGNRRGQRRVHLEKNNCYFGTGSDMPYMIDMDTDKRRYSTQKDVENAIKLMDSLENYDFVMSYCIANDAPKMTNDLHQFKVMVANTIKPIIFTAHSAEHTQAIIDMAALAVGGYDNLRNSPLMVLYSEPISPLIHTEVGIGKMFKCHEYGIPVVYTPGVVAGATMPVTKAGTIALMNAEALAGVVISQLHVKGAPIIIGGGATPMDMRTTATLYGSPDAQMNYAIMTQLSQYYQIPNFTEAGCVNAPLPDAQAGFEAGIGLLTCQLAGANLVHDVGYLEGGKTGYLPFLVMCDDYIAGARHMGRGTRIDEETLAIDVIDEVGVGNNFLNHQHTFDHFREEIWQPRLFNRYIWEDWEQRGKKSYLDAHKDEVRRVLEADNPNLVDNNTITEMDKIIAIIEK
ncbi:MAG: trimethylamine methyltransferase [Desulfitibacter sp. BRH_c19]|nr:MAG: trimethylamine methyltransferase [Desulfitibacter sp. BRH_c19]